MRSKVLPRSFYARNTVNVAKDLLGKTLNRKIGKKIISGIIIETEAYRYKDDPASHAFRGMTERNKIMFGEVGLAYVYFTYGMHYCVNAVAKSKTFDAGAVLIRSIKPNQGIKEMLKNRKIDSIANLTNGPTNLTNGPAKLTQAMQINKKQYGEDLASLSSLFITEGIKPPKISSNQRIGIKNGLDKLWNFKIELRNS